MRAETTFGCKLAANSAPGGFWTQCTGQRICSVSSIRIRSPIFCVRMGSGEATVIRWVPILRGKHKIELRTQLIDHGDDPIPFRDRQSASRKEIVLHIHYDERFHTMG